MNIAAGEFKTKCLNLMNQVQDSHEEIVITKFGKPVAKLVPIEETPGTSPFGCLKGTVSIHGDIAAPTGEKWDAEN